MAGAGMAGLAAAAHARARGASVLLLEKGDRPGGAMRLSSGVIWRHARLRATSAPSARAATRRSSGSCSSASTPTSTGWRRSARRVTERETGNPRTTGVRFDTAGLTTALARAGGRRAPAARRCASCPDGARSSSPPAASRPSRELVREHVTPEADELLLRAAPWSTGDGLRLGLAAGARARAPAWTSSTAAACPRRPRASSERTSSRLAQLYARHATVTNARRRALRRRAPGRRSTSCSGPRASRGARALATAWRRTQLGERVRERTVAEMVAAAERAGAPVRRDRDGAVAVQVRGGDHDHARRAARRRRRAARRRGVWAAGADAGGIATGGYASGLAAALVSGASAAAAAPLEGR